MKLIDKWKITRRGKRIEKLFKELNELAKESSSIKWVENEIKLYKSNILKNLKKKNEIKDAPYSFECADAALQLIKLFSLQEHSGYSAGITTKFFTKLINHEILCPIIPIDEDGWNKINFDVYQHSRCSKLFKCKDGENWIYDFIDAYIMKKVKIFDISTKKLYVGDNSEWSGMAYIYNPNKNEWTAYQKCIINPEKAFYSNIQFNIPVIKLYDSDDAKHNHDCCITSFEYVPKDFFDIYTPYVLSEYKAGIEKQIKWLEENKIHEVLNLLDDEH